MVPLGSLWMPIVLSAVLVFFASFILHMVLTYHRSDWRKVPREDDVLSSLRGFNIPPGDYMLPCGGSPAAMKDPAFVEKMNKGPIVLMTLVPGGSASMGKSLALWFVFSLVVSLFAAYLTSRAHPAGTDYREVFRFAGTAAFMGYSLALAQQSIWYMRSWTTTTKSMLDGLLYGLLTGGTFGWLWPR